MTNTDRFKLTDANIKADCRLPESGELNLRGQPLQERFYGDTELRGFGIVARAQSKSFVVQKDVKGRPVRVTIGRFPDWNTTMARKRARELIVERDSGGNPNVRKRAEAVRGVTLAEAMQWHFDAMRADHCSERTIHDMKYEIGMHLADWLKRPLAEITRNDCATRHRRITERSGPYAANRAMRFFRASYNTADKRMEKELPRCPVVAVNFNKEKRRQEPIPWSRSIPGGRATSLPPPVRAPSPRAKPPVR